MRAFALGLAGTTTFVALPAAADTSPTPPVTVVVVPGAAPGVAPPPPSYPPGAYPAPPPGAYYPPPGYYAPPGPYYAPPGAYPGLQPMERRSAPAMAGGIVGVTAGAISLFSALFVAVIADSTCSVVTFDGSGRTTNSCDSHAPAVIGLTVAGIAGIAIGIPLIIYGAKKVPLGTASSGNNQALQSPLPAWAGAPGGTGWRWRF